MTDGMNRRGFLKVLGATGGGAVALSGCSSDAAEKLIPYLVPPENQIPGVATYYATTCRECSAGCGLHVKVREGRAIKLEGNPDSPINAGKLCALGQAGLQGLYNPDRVKAPMRKGADGEFVEISWEDAVGEIVTHLGNESGDRIAFLTGNESGSFDTLVKEWLAAHGSSNHVVYEALGYEALRAANRQLFGVDAIPSYDLASAKFIISFGADFLETWLSPVENTRGFTEAHSYSGGTMGRYVHIDPRMGQSAIQADEWIAPKPGSEGAVALAMANVILRVGAGNIPPDVFRVRTLIESMTPDVAAELSGVSAEVIERLAGEFTESRSVALGGGMGAQHEAADSTAIAVMLLNYVAGNVGETVRFKADAPAATGSYADLRALRDSMSRGDIGVLFVHGADPVYQSGFGSAEMDNVGFKVSFSSYLDETASACDLILPDNHPLEQWNDFRPASGGYLLQQPVMRPVFDTRQTGDVLLTLASATGNNSGGLGVTNYKEYLRDQWRSIQRGLQDRSQFEVFWNSSLQHGGVTPDSADTRMRLARSASQAVVSTWSPSGEGLTLIVYPSPTLGDGRGANKPWLQELPDPITKITWGNWLEMSPATAEELGVVSGDLVDVTTLAGATVMSDSLPVFVYPGIRDGVVALPMGQGHRGYGRYADNDTVNPTHLLSPQATTFGGRSHYNTVTVGFGGGHHERLAQTMGRNRQMGRGISQFTTLAALIGHGEEEHHGQHAAPIPEHIEEIVEEWQEAQWDDFRDKGNYAGEHPRWGLSVDLAKCTGCNACVTACYAENNIPTVGKDQVQRGREMSWIRIERYFEGGENGEPHEISLLPMMCQQCMNAPCEPVCPVFAAYRTPDGLNAQIYNRCVGTRYCANNCPYKVRYFNYYDHQQPGDPFFSFPEPLHWQLNPDVTVRSKGVMEKCTFCVQRIRGAQHDASTDGRELVDGDIQTACQQTCPADAIVFGDLNDPNSRVSQLAADERAYHVLGGLNTKPAVTYLKQVRNRAEA